MCVSVRLLNESTSLVLVLNIGSVAASYFGSCYK